MDHELSRRRFWQYGALSGALGLTAWRTMPVGATQDDARARPVSVTEFGAKGDGETDDTDAIQQALDQRGAIHVPPGDYLCNRLYLHSDTQLTGSGWTSRLILKPQDFGERLPSDEWGGVLNCYGGGPDAMTEHILVAHLALHGNRGKHTPDEYSHYLETLELDYVRRFLLFNLYVEGAVADGIDVDACEDGLILGCTCVRNGKYGIHVTRDSDNNPSRRVRVIGCHLEANGDLTTSHSGGMDINYSADCLAMGNVAVDNQHDENTRGFYLGFPDAFGGNRFEANLSRSNSGADVVQKDGVMAMLSASLTIPNDTATGIPWDAVEYAERGMVDPDEPQRFTIPDGVTKARLGVSVAWGLSGQGRREITVTKNGESFPGAARDVRVAVTGTHTVQQASTPIIDVQPGDCFEARARQTSGADLDIEASDETWFWLEVIA